MSDRYEHAPTETIDIAGTRFAYRQLGADTGVPVFFLNHLAAVLDNWDPRVVDGIAAKHRVIAFDNRGVGASTVVMAVAPCVSRGCITRRRVGWSCGSACRRSVQGRGGGAC